MNIQQLELKKVEALPDDDTVTFYFGPTFYRVLIAKSVVEEWVKKIDKMAIYAKKLEPTEKENPLFKNTDSQRALLYETSMARHFNFAKGETNEADPHK